MNQLQAECLLDLAQFLEETVAADEHLAETFDMLVYGGQPQLYDLAAYCRQEITGEQLHECGTRCCAAGWLMIRSGKKLGLSLSDTGRYLLDNLYSIRPNSETLALALNVPRADSDKMFFLPDSDHRHDVRSAARRIVEVVDKHFPEGVPRA